MFYTSNDVPLAIDAGLSTTVLKTFVKNLMYTESSSDDIVDDDLP